jgi:ERCC4-type nuclease
MPDWVVTVDTNSNEDALETAIRAELNAREPGRWTFRRARLDLGDARVQYVAQGGVTHSLLIERKHWPDWAASVQDGRYKEQKARWQRVAVAEQQEGSDERSRFVYLIEGPTVSPMEGLTRGERGISNAAVTAAALKTAVRDAIPVLRSAGPQDSGAVCAYLARAFVKGELHGAAAARATAGVCVGLAPAAHKRKRANLEDPRALMGAMLGCVPGMSEARAAVVAERFPTARRLARVDEAELADVYCGQRRLGGALASAIKKVFS